MDDGTADPFDYHDILDHIDTPLFVTDDDGSLLHWNKAVQRLTGHTAAEAKRKETRHGVIGPAFYHDGRYSKTLAENFCVASSSLIRMSS